MHIMEGFLPPFWAAFWWVIALPFMIYGVYAMRKFFIEHPDKKLSVALSGAFIVILSSLKIPSITGSSSHPTGTGLSVMLSGPWITVVICTIVLLFQGTFLAHGGFTTLGANVFSMGIAGPFAAYFIFKFLLSHKVHPTVTVFTVAFVADFVTYIVTALQLSLVVPYTGIGDFASTYTTFLGIFAVTQLPLALAEGVLFVFFFQYLADVRPELVKHIGYDTSVRQSKSILSDETKDKVGIFAMKTRSKVMMAGFAIVGGLMVVLAYFFAFFRDMGGADDAGAETIEGLTGNGAWIENFIQFSEEHLTILFLVQTIIGLLILAYVIHWLRKRKRKASEAREEV